MLSPKIYKNNMFENKCMNPPCRNKELISSKYPMYVLSKNSLGIKP
jgi:hypothetical protein